MGKLFPFSLRRTAAVLATSLVLATTTVGGAHAIALKQQVRLTGQQLYLSDLFSGLSPSQDRLLTSAPASGEHVVYTLATLKRIAQTFGLDWQPAPDDRDLAIERGNTRLGAHQIADMLRQHLQQEVGDADLEIRFDRQHPSIDIADGVEGRPRVIGIYRDSRSSRFEALLEVPGHHGTHQVTITGQAISMLNVPVLAMRLGRGEVIRADHLSYRRARADQLTPDIITDSASLIGLAPRRALGPDRLISAAMLTAAIVIPRGALVMMTFERPGITLSAQGQAVEQGAIGDVIRVMNTSSELVVQGVVTAPGHVKTLSGTTFARSG
jgi:flagella basal body P-ring formation protein FlgA